MATAQVMLDTSRYVRVNNGYNRVVLQSLRDVVRVVFSDIQPATGNSVYHMLSGSDSALVFDVIDTNIWVLATSTDCSLLVTEVTKALPVASLSPFDSAVDSGKAFAKSTPIIIPANTTYSIVIKGDAVLNVNYVKAQGARIDVKRGTVNNLIALTELLNVRLNGGNSAFYELHDDQTNGDTLFSARDTLVQSFYSDVIEITNTTDQPLSTDIGIGVEAVTQVGTYQILRSNTQLTANTQMSDYNGAN